MYSRTRQLIGEQDLQRLQESHVLVVGLGGVGGYVAEMLARAGIGTLSLVDADVVQPSNINRQLIATATTIGVKKTTLFEQRLKEINPDIKLYIHPIFIKDEVTEELLSLAHYDFVVDAIDTLSPKVNLIKSLVNRKIPFVSAMGAGAKEDPRSLRVARMEKVNNCTLARFIRKRLRKMQVPLKFTVVYSEELPKEEAVITVEGEANKKSTAGTISYMPAMMGCYCAYVAIDHLRHKIGNPEPQV